MRLTTLLSLVCLTSASAPVLADGPDASADQDRPGSTITIAHTNDFHGRILPFEAAPGSATSQTGDPGRPPAQFDRVGEIGGMAWLAGAVDNLRTERGADRVLLLDAGDTFGDSYLGNKTQGEAMIRAMNAVGYDMMALGNHDFDYGLARTAALARIADFPLRGANVKNGQDEPVFGRPWQVFDLGQARVAVLALGYQNTDQTGNPNNFADLTFGDGLAATRRHLPAMQDAADVIVVLSHQGTAVDRKLAAEVEGIDLIIGGHSHDRIIPPEHIEDTWMVQAMSDGALLGVTTLMLDADHDVADVKAKAIPLWHDQVEPDPQVAKLMAAQARPYREAMNTVLAHAVDRIDRQYKSPSAFDRMVGNAMRQHTGAEVAFMPGVGYGVSLSPGPVTRGDLYTLLPHPAKLVTMKLTGAQIASVLEQTATNLAPGDPMDRVGGLVQTSGLSYTADLRDPTGSRISTILVNGQPLIADRIYDVAANAGIARGLHRYAAFPEGRDRVTHDVTVTEVVENAFKARDALVSPAMTDIRIIPSDATGNNDATPVGTTS